MSRPLSGNAFTIFIGYILPLTISMVAVFCHIQYNLLKATLSSLVLGFHLYGALTISAVSSLDAMSGYHFPE